MRTTISISTWLFLLSVTFLGSVSLVQAETIRSFIADIEVQPNGDLRVSETIVYDFESNEKRGIYRNITDNHSQPRLDWFRNRYIESTLLSVYRNGLSDEVSIDSSYNGLSVRIGQPDVTITGENEYLIVYTVRGALVETENGYEVYWNVTGDEWNVPMERVDVVVRAGEDVQFADETFCYVGPTYNTECAISRINDAFTVFSVASLPARQQITVAQALILSEEPIMLTRLNLWLILPVFLLLLIGVLGFKTYRWRTEYKLNKPVVAQYEPYQDFKPMFTGVLLDNRLDPQDITAGLIYLAQQGFIAIKQTTDKVLFLFDSHDYEVTLKRPLSETRSSFQVDLLMILFYGQQVATDKSKLFSFKFHSLTPDPSKNEMKVGKTIRLSEVKANNPKQRSNLKLIKQLKKDVEKDLVEQGFIEQRMSRSMKGWLVGGSVFVLFFGFQAVSLDSFEFFVTAFLGAIVLMVTIGFSLERRTRKGYEALNHLIGFKDFLSTTEKDRYEFHNATEKNPEQFMEFLPYAIAFKVEKEWAEVFADIQMSDPDWYQTDVPGAHFSALTFSNEIGSFSSSFASSSGSSGSSGGGSAGGGAGGGGGGSW